MYCPRCGSEVPQGASFCARCGWKVGTSPEAGSAQSTGSAANASDIAHGAVSSVTDKLNEMAGGTGHVELKFSNFFDAVPKHHTSDEAAELFACGSPSTTPRLSEVVSEWPHPWLWSRVLVVLVVAAFVLYLFSSYLSNSNGLPGFIFIASAATPLAALVFFFETNAFRDLGFGEVLKVFLIGGAASLVITQLLDEVVPSGAGDLGPSLLTGVVEECAKFLIVAIVLVRSKKKVHILSALLIGAAVGAGFAIFESAGYAFRTFLASGLETVLTDPNLFASWEQQASQYSNVTTQITLLLEYVYKNGFPSMMNTIVLRGALGFGGHVAWAAVEGGALALVAYDRPAKWGDLASPRFLKFAVICIVLHGIWDATVPVLDSIDLGFPGGPKYLILIAAVWVVIYVLLNRGLEQANELSKQAAQGQ